MDKKTSPEMIADALRETGVLAIVLVPVDIILTQGPVHWRVIAYALSAGFLFLTLGIALERIRP